MPTYKPDTRCLLCQGLTVSGCGAYIQAWHCVSVVSGPYCKRLWYLTKEKTIGRYSSNQQWWLLQWRCHGVGRHTGRCCNCLSIGYATAPLYIYFLALVLWDTQYSGAHLQCINHINHLNGVDHMLIIDRFFTLMIHNWTKLPIMYLYFVPGLL